MRSRKSRRLEPVMTTWTRRYTWRLLLLVPGIALAAACTTGSSGGGEADTQEARIEIDINKGIVPPPPGALRPADVNIGVRVTGPGLPAPIFAGVPYNPDGPSVGFVNVPTSDDVLFQVLVFAAVCPINNPNVVGCEGIPPFGVDPRFENNWSPRPIDTLFGRTRVNLEGGDQDVVVNLNTTPLPDIDGAGGPHTFAVWPGTPLNPGGRPVRGVKVRVLDRVIRTPMPFREGLVTEHGECWDFFENDTDGQIDFPNDVNCYHPMDPNESPNFSPPNVPPLAEMRDAPLNRKLNVVALVARLGIANLHIVELATGGGNTDLYLGLGPNQALVSGRLFKPQCQFNQNECKPVPNQQVELRDGDPFVGPIVGTTQTDNLGYFFFAGDFQGQGVFNVCPRPSVSPLTVPVPHVFTPNLACMPVPGGGGVLDFGDFTWSGFSGSGGPFAIRAH